MASSSSSAITLRVRTQLGTWRLNNVNRFDTIGTIRTRVEAEHKTDLMGKPITIDQLGKNQIDDRITVAQAGLKHGDMVYALVDEEKTATHEMSTMGKMITKDGNIIQQSFTDVANKNGFRPGMMPLRSMKMAWTLNEFISLDEQYQYKIKAQAQGFCTKADMNVTAIEDFKQYMTSYDYRKIRIGYLYGTFESDNSAKIVCIYEPPQDTTDTSFELLEDSKAETVEALANMLGLVKVGWILSHPPREKGFFFSGAEIIFAAEQSLEAANGVNDTPFVNIRVTVDETNNVVVDATQGKAATEVDTTFFVINTPITSFESDVLSCMFPKCNREREPTFQDLKTQISKEGQKGWKLIDLLADFHLLLFLSNFLSIHEDIPQICRSIMHREIPLDEGHVLLIRSYAGMDP